MAVQQGPRAGAEGEHTRRLGDQDLILIVILLCSQCHRTFHYFGPDSPPRLRVHDRHPSRPCTRTPFSVSPPPSSSPSGVSRPVLPPGRPHRDDLRDRQTRSDSVGLFGRSQQAGQGEYAYTHACTYTCTHTCYLLSDGR